MGHYKGKRESSRPENEQTNLRQSEPRKQQETVNDPFAGEKPGFGERVENTFLDINWFFHSKKGKTIVGVLCSILLIAVVGVVGFKAWMSRPPELPPVRPERISSRGRIRGSRHRRTTVRTNRFLRLMMSSIPMTVTAARCRR